MSRVSDPVLVKQDTRHTTHAYNLFRISYFIIQFYFINTFIHIFNNCFCQQFSFTLFVSVLVNVSLQVKLGN